MLTEREQFLEWLMQNELPETAVRTVITGDACGCIAGGRDSITPSEQWHRLNPTEDACDGTGLTSPVSTDTNIKGVCLPVGVSQATIPFADEIKTEIGKIQKDDHIWWGTVNTADGSYIDLSTMEELRDYITYDSIKYIVMVVKEVAGIGQVAYLQRKE